MRNHLEIRTTISPTPFFFRRIHYMAASMRRLGAMVGDHEIVVSVGGGSTRDNPYLSQPWSNMYPITWRWVDPEVYAKLGYEATNRDRYWHMGRAKMIMLADADVIFVEDFSDLLTKLEISPAICGVMAHVSPFLNAGERSPDAWWRMLAEAFDVSELPLDQKHSGWNCMPTEESFIHSPSYFNGGMIVGSIELIPAASDAVDSVIKSYFRPQLARTLAMHKARLPSRPVPLRYNFPNDQRFEDAQADELADLRILHYLRRQVVDRDRDFMTTESVGRLIARTDLHAANEKLRQLLAELHDEVATEARANVKRGSAGV